MLIFSDVRSVLIYSFHEHVCSTSVVTYTCVAVDVFLPCMYIVDEILRLH